MSSKRKTFREYVDYINSCDRNETEPIQFNECNFNALVDYSEYLSKQLDDTIKYTDYLKDNLENLITYINLKSYKESEYTTFNEMRNNGNSENEIQTFLRNNVRKQKINNLLDNER